MKQMIKKRNLLIKNNKFNSCLQKIFDKTINQKTYYYIGDVRASHVHLLADFYTQMADGYLFEFDYLLSVKDIDYLCLVS